MGLKLDNYGDNFVGLTVDFSFTDNSSYFFSGDSVQEAIEYFDLYIDKDSARLKRRSVGEKIIDSFDISNNTVEDFKKSIKDLTKTFSDEDAVAHQYIIEKWDTDVKYSINDYVRYENAIYKCIQPHTSQEDNSPSKSTLAWIALSTQEPSQWASGVSYQIGDKITYNGEKYECLLANCVWSPTDYPSGWKKM